METVIYKKTRRITDVLSESELTAGEATWRTHKRTRTQIAAEQFCLCFFLELALRTHSTRAQT